MESDKNRQPETGKSIVIIIMAMILVVMSLNAFHQSKVINRLNDFKKSEEDAVLAAATKAFRQYFKESREVELNPETLGGYVPRLRYTEKNPSSWIVEFTFTYEGTTAKITETFIVEKTYESRYESTYSSGGF